MNKENRVILGISLSVFLVLSLFYLSCTMILNMIFFYFLNNHNLDGRMLALNGLSFGLFFGFIFIFLVLIICLNKHRKGVLSFKDGCARFFFREQNNRIVDGPT